MGLFIMVWVSPTLVSLILALAIGAGFGYWGGLIGARNVKPENRNDVIWGGVIVGVLLLGVLTPLVWWMFSPREAQHE